MNRENEAKRTDKPLREQQVEEKLRQAIKAMGGIAYKFTSPGNIGVPDRVVLLPNGRVWFVELKADAGRLTPNQERQLQKIRGTGCNACTLYGIEDVKAFLAARQAELDGHDL